jgi:hypothetical protein
MTKFTAIDPAGKTHKRTSKERTYTHTVVALPSAPKAVLAATSKEARAMHRKNFVYHLEMANGTSKWLERNSWETEAQHAEREANGIDNGMKALRGCKNAQEYESVMTEISLAAIRERRAKGYYDTYQSMGWCGRADLAEKLKTSCENRGWIEITILEVL